MRRVEEIYVDGQFVEPHGQEMSDLYNPATGRVIGQVRLGDAMDARIAVAAAKRALSAFSRTDKVERIALLQRMHAAVVARADDLTDATILEYGAPLGRAQWAARHAAQTFLDAAQTLRDYPLTRQIASAEVVMEPVGVVGLITPWNSNAGFVCGKLAYALAAGCTAVIKPS